MRRAGCSSGKVREPAGGERPRAHRASRRIGSRQGVRLSPAVRGVRHGAGHRSRKLPAVLLAVPALALLANAGVLRGADAVFPFEMREIVVPMSDGGRLVGDLYLPGEGAYPTLLIISQASREKWRSEHLPLTSASRSGDYAIVFVNTRGRGSSRDNPRRPGVNPFGWDGYDVVEWIAAQSWSDGKVGMWGGSNEGKNAYATAHAQPPHLVCMVPALTTPDTKEPGALPRGYQQVYRGGVLRRELVDRFPPGRVLNEILRHRLADASFWDRRPLEAPTLGEIEVPVLAVGAWFDNDVNGTGLRTFSRLLDAASDELRPHHRLIVAPWIHNSMFQDGKHGQLLFDNTAERYRREEKRFFDHWLRGVENGEETAPTITYYQIGVNEWRTTPVWPPAGARETPFYLHPGGVLSRDDPAEGAPPSHFVSDPGNPVPTVGGQNKSRGAGKGPYDQRGTVEGHPDVIVFSTPPLEEDVEVAGRVQLEFHLSSDAPDTHLAFRLTDVHPDGRSMLLRDAILRLALRRSFSRVEPLTPGEIYAGTVDTFPVAHTFRRGHRIRVLVSGSNYPRWEVSRNTLDEEAEPRVARNALHLDARHPSALVLSVRQVD